MKRSPMPPRTKPMTRTPLARSGEPGRYSSLERNTPIRPVSARRAAENRERRVMLRAKYPAGIVLCEVPWCAQVADDAHEPLTRARGGLITDPENVRAVCRSHHDEITFEEPDWAYQYGFLIHSWAVPRAQN